MKFQFKFIVTLNKWGYYPDALYGRLKQSTPVVGFECEYGPWRLWNDSEPRKVLGKLYDMDGINPTERAMIKVIGELQSDINAAMVCSPKQ